MEQAVKQRLVGAAVLAALAVITLPMVFDTRRPDAVRVPEIIPAQPNLPNIVVAEPQPVAPLDATPPVPVSEMYHLDGEKAVPTDDVSQVAPAPVAQPASSATAVKGAAAQTSAKPLPPVPPAPGGKLNTAGMPEAWVVQVAAMSDKKKADALIAQLKLNGQPAFSAVTHGEKGDTIRVFIGPKLDKAKAVHIKQQVDKDMGLQTMVVPFAPK